MVVSGCGNCLLLQVRPPSSVGMLSTDLYMDLVLNVKRTRDGAQVRVLNCDVSSSSGQVYAQENILSGFQKT